MAEYKDARTHRQNIARETLDAIDRGFYTHKGVTRDISVNITICKQGTRYYAPDSLLSSWSSVSSNKVRSPAEVSLLEISTLEGARLLNTIRTPPSTPTARSRIGILNFASAKKAGGGFLSGAQAQEESIARSSTLYPSLRTATAQHFYTLHNRDSKGGYYSHAMIYSPGVVLFRDDAGGWVHPLEVDVLTSPAVNAAVARKTVYGRFAGAGVEKHIANAMRERMARILFLFEQQGVRDLVLGSFGTGVFHNDVTLVASIWKELLLMDDSRFRHSFDRVLFAVLGKQTYKEFQLVLDVGTDDG